jgi:hypothetical protein
MDENDFEGSKVLELLASMNLVDEFFEAIDSDDISAVVSLLRDASIDEETITAVLRKIEDQ